MKDFFALIVGVGGKDIPETVKDAKAIYSILADNSKGAYSPKNTFLLTEINSTSSKIIETLDHIITKSDTDSTVFIYYSGHGQRFHDITNDDFEYYLVTHGADSNNKEGTMLNGDIFSEKISLIKAGKLIVMLDCCHAAGMGKLKTKGSIREYSSNRTLQEKLESGKGRVFISSCDDDETSVILPSAENSLFTQVAIEILSGLFSPKREYVSALDLIFTLLQEVPRRIEPFDHEQTPILTSAAGLDHKYVVCKNGKYDPPNDHDNKLEDSYNNNDDENFGDEINFDNDNDKYLANKFFKNTKLDHILNDKIKIDIGKEMGLDRLEEANEKIGHINLSNYVNDIKTIAVENIIQLVEDKIEEEYKINFINNYKNRI